jgi:hypothetical protein
MLFFKIEAQMKNMSEYQNGKKQEKYASELQPKLLDFHQKHADGWLVYISSMRGTLLTMGAIMHKPESLEEAVQDFLAAANIECEIIDIGEITLQVTESLLDSSDRNKYIKDDRVIYRLFGLEDIVNRPQLKFKEILLPASAKKRELIKKANQMLCSERIKEELVRIYQPAVHSALGHPVHYLIQSENTEVSENISDLLLSALYSNNRVRSRRFCTVYLNNNNYFDEDEYLGLYKACTGGAVIVLCRGGRGRR